MRKRILKSVWKIRIFIMELEFKLLQHPPCSPDSAPSDFFSISKFEKNDLADNGSR